MTERQMDDWIRQQAGRVDPTDASPAELPARPARADAGAGVRRPETPHTPQERASAWLRDAVDRARFWR